MSGENTSTTQLHLQPNTTTTATNTSGSITIPAVQVPTPPPPAKLFDESALNKARQDERDKLYGRLNEQSETLSTLQSKLAAMEEERRAEAEAVAKAKQDAEAARKAREEAEMSAKDFVKAESERWAAQLEAMERQRAEERAIFEKERAFNELRQYTQAQVEANREKIAPELLDMVTGNSREEIDASIERLTAKSAAIVEALTAAAAQARQANLRGVSPTGRPNIGPLDTDPATRTLSPQDISAMSMDEYSAYRQQLLAAASNHVRTTGLYG